MLYVAITSLIGGLQIFDIPFLVAPEGQPNNALLTVVAYLYKMAFKYNQIGYAGAIAFILFFIIAICSVIIYFAMYSKKEEN
jgi:multiple sugar transport system permease protein